MSNDVLKAVGAMTLTGFFVGAAAYWRGYAAGETVGESTGRLENQRQSLQVCDGVYNALAENSKSDVTTAFADDRVFAIKMAMALPEGNPMREVYLARSEQIRHDAETALYLQQNAATLAGTTCRQSLENLANR